jgi:hypothetical protein
MHAPAVTKREVTETAPVRRTDRAWEIGAALALAAVLLLAGAAALYRYERQRQLDQALLRTFREAGAMKDRGVSFAPQLARARRLIHDGASVRQPDVFSTTSLLWAVGLDDAADEAPELDLAGYILDRGADVNQRSLGITALGSAAGLGEPAMVALLLKRGADPNLPSGGLLPLRFAEGTLLVLRRMRGRVLPGRIERQRAVIHLLRQAGARE